MFKIYLPLEGKMIPETFRTLNLAKKYGEDNNLSFWIYNSMNHVVFSNC